MVCAHVTKYDSDRGQSITGEIHHPGACPGGMQRRTDLDGLVLCQSRSGLTVPEHESEAVSLQFLGE
jgi:hypothetical protein